MLLLSTVAPADRSMAQPEGVGKGGGVQAIGRGHSLTATTALAVFLDRRTRHRAIRTEHATIARERFELLVATFADVEELARVNRHLLDGLMVALRTGQRGLQLHQRAAGGEER